jgi:RNA polymerase sigma-70 factor (ECF subfamily)
LGIIDLITRFPTKAVIVANFRNDLIELLPRLRRFALALSGPSQDADDLVQSAIERALRHPGSWKDGTRLDSWMYKILQNLWIDEIRSRRRRADPIDSAAQVVGEDGRDVTSVRIDLAAAQRAMAALPEEQRLVLTLVVLDGMSYQEAADTLDVPIGTIMSRVARGRAAVVTRLTNEPASKAQKQWSN